MTSHIYGHNTIAIL